MEKKKEIEGCDWCEGHGGYLPGLPLVIRDLASDQKIWITSLLYSSAAILCLGTVESTYGMSQVRSDAAMQVPFPELTHLLLFYYIDETEPALQSPF